MAMSKKHQTVGQRYQIGDRVYRKSVTLGSGNGNTFRTRYGTITDVDTNINAVGAVNYYYMVKWEGSNSGSPNIFQTYTAQLPLIVVSMPTDTRLNNL